MTPAPMRSVLPHKITGRVMVTDAAGMMASESSRMQKKLTVSET